MSAASENLRSNQRQLDMDGCEVGVSRQALDEVLAEHAVMLAALRIVDDFCKDFQEAVLHVAEVVAEAVRNRMGGLTQTFAGKQRRGGCG